MSNRDETMRVDRRIAMKYLGIAGASLLLAGCEAVERVRRQADTKHEFYPPKDREEGHGGR
jgi:uncharacterized lipoprotein YajG